jgi:hypothetical protein
VIYVTTYEECISITSFTTTRKDENEKILLNSGFPPGLDAIV